MKFLILFALACIVATAMSAPQETKYTDKWDNINLDEILASDRLLNKYTDCLLDRGRCAPEAKTLKETLPDALENECSKCTEKQREGSTKVIRHFVNNRPDLWKQLEAKYDPTGKFAEKYRDTATKEGIALN